MLKRDFHVMAAKESKIAFNMCHASNLIKLAEVSENIPDRRRFLNTLSEMRSKAIVLKQTRSACIEDLEDTYPGISRDEVEKGKDEIKRLVRKKEYRPNRRG